MIDEQVTRADVAEANFGNLVTLVHRLQDQIDPTLRDWSKTQDRLDKLERVGDQWSTRAWGLGEKLLIAAVAAALGYYLKR